MRVGQQLKKARMNPNTFSCHKEVQGSIRTTCRVTRLPRKLKMFVGGITMVSNAAVTSGRSACDKFPFRKKRRNDFCSRQHKQLLKVSHAVIN